MRWGASACLFLCFAQAQDQRIWKEIGLQSTETKDQITTWKFADSTAALAGLGEILASTPDRAERIGPEAHAGPGPERDR